MGEGDHFTSIDPLWEKTPSVSPYAYADNNPLRMTDPTGLQAVMRVPYVGSVEWLEYGVGGGGGGVAPLVAIGVAITYGTQHPEQSVPFMARMASDISQALTNPIGFATNTVGLLLAASGNNPAVPPIPADPTEAPGPEWEWRGKQPTGGDKGASYNPDTGETLHPDPNHPLPIGPHWDYINPDGDRYRVFPDGRVEPNTK